MLSSHSPGRQSQPRAEGELHLPPVVLGCATFGYGLYQDTSNIVSDLPVRVVRLALRSGITAFDTGEPMAHTPARLQRVKGE